MFRLISTYRINLIKEKLATTLAMLDIATGIGPEREKTPNVLAMAVAVQARVAAIAADYPALKAEVQRLTKVDTENRAEIERLKADLATANERLNSIEDKVEAEPHVGAGHVLPPDEETLHTMKTISREKAMDDPILKAARERAGVKPDFVSQIPSFTRREKPSRRVTEADIDSIAAKNGQTITRALERDGLIKKLPKPRAKAKS